MPGKKIFKFPLFNLLWHLYIHDVFFIYLLEASCCSFIDIWSRKSTLSYKNSP